MGNSLGLLLLGVALAAGMVFSTMVASETVLRVKRQNEFVEVKGFAATEITSDWSTWKATYTARGESLASAYARLDRDRAVVTELLEDQGGSARGAGDLPGDDRGPLPPGRRGTTLEPDRGLRAAPGGLRDLQCGRSHRTARELGPRSSWAAASRSSRSGRSTSTARSTTSRPSSSTAATENARDRAKTLASNSKQDIGRLVGARQGVFQITPPHSTEVSNWGRNDTSTKLKSVKATVTVRYAIE